MAEIDSLSTVQDWEGYFASFHENLAPVAYDTGRNIALAEPFPTVNPQQTAWARQMGRRIYMPVEGRIYVAVGYQLCSTTMIVGTDGVIIIDPGENDQRFGEAMADLRRFSDLPVRAVIYTHRHPDHCFAIEGAGITAEDVTSGRVDVIAHETFQQWLINDASVIGPALQARTSITAYAGMDPHGHGVVHGALGPNMAPGPMSTYLPTITIAGPTDLELAGVRMTVFPAYGDAQDEIDVWFPDFDHVHGSETIQGETFPNLYTLRGTSYRDVESWYHGVDTLLSYARKANSYSGSHMRPWVGNAFIVERITNYRDAIQFLFDQSVRHMNRGATGPELIDLVAAQLPDHLRDDPWLQPYYGAPEHCVREIYTGLLGWYTGDPTELAAPLHRDRAQRYVTALGGRDRVLEQARASIDAGDEGWAMELLTHLVRTDTTDTEARHLKATAMRNWGYQQPNMYWRNLALGGANELDDTIDLGQTVEFAPAGVVRALPTTKVVESLRVRLDPTKTADIHLAIGFDFTDSGHSCTLEIRRGVAVYHDGLPIDTAATLILTDDVVHELLLHQTTPAEAMEAGKATVKGDQDKVREFFGYFDKPPTEPPLIVTR